MIYLNLKGREAQGVVDAADAGALRDELAYFVNCIATGEQPTVITPEESREAVRACLAAEESARTGLVIRI